MNITKEQFNEYTEVQLLGAYNMFSPKAMAMTNLSKQEWLYIMKNYRELMEKYDK